MCVFLVDQNTCAVYWLRFLLVLILAWAGLDLLRSVGVEVNSELLEPLDALHLPPKVG